MPATPSTDRAWEEIKNQIFAVLGFVSRNGEARTAGICYIVKGKEFFIATERRSWKARHIEGNPNVSMTVTIPKRIPLLPWIKIPPATITFQGRATIFAIEEISGEIQRSLLRSLELDSDAKKRTCIIRVTPSGEFVTYGVGVPLLTMRHPEQARGRAPVALPGP